MAWFDTPKYGALPYGVSKYGGSRYGISAGGKVASNPAGAPTAEFDIRKNLVGSVWSAIGDAAKYFTGAGGAASPTVESSVFGSAPAWSFDGINDYANATGMGGLTNGITSRTVYMLVSIGSNSAGGKTLYHTSRGTSTLNARGSVQLGAITAGKVGILTRRLDTESSAAGYELSELYVVDEVVVYGFTWDFSVPEVKVYKNGSRIRTISLSALGTGAGSETNSQLVSLGTSDSSAFAKFKIGYISEYKNGPHGATMHAAMNAYIRKLFNL